RWWPSTLSSGGSPVRHTRTSGRDPATLLASTWATAMPMPCTGPLESLCSTWATTSRQRARRALLPGQPESSGHTGGAEDATSVEAMETAQPLDLTYPFRGRWQVRNSPANRVPSHCSDLFATTYAIDFVPVDESGRSAFFGFNSL